MKLTLQLQLVPTRGERDVLLRTMEQFNAAASYAASVGFADGVFSQPPLHYRCYYTIRERFGLSAQMAVRAIAKAVEVFRRDKTRCPRFKPHGAITYDERILSWKGLDAVSLWTMEGRKRFPILYGEYQRQRLDRLAGQVDLVYRRGRFFLFATIDVPDRAPVEVQDFLGIDLGIVNVATDSDGRVHTGTKVEAVRRRHLETRRRLQRRQTRGATKLLRGVAGREARFRRHENHRISKTIVQCAKDTGRGIALEDLTHIRTRTTVRRSQRARHAGWAFAQLRAFTTYKAARDGVPIVVVDPRNSSRTCSTCGHCAATSRKTRDQFLCVHCGLSLPADLNAARVLRAWAARKPASELSAA